MLSPYVRNRGQQNRKRSAFQRSARIVTESRILSPAKTVASGYNPRTPLESAAFAVLLTSPQGQTKLLEPR